MSDRGNELEDESRRPFESGAETRTERPKGRDDRSAAESGDGTESIPIDTPAEPEPGAGSDATSPGPDRGPNAIRNWTVITAALALVSALTAVAIVAIHGAAMPALGATALGVGFAAIAAVSRTTVTDAVGVLADGWAEHRPYVWFATGLFGFGAIVGALLVAAGVDLTELLLEMLLEEFDEEELAGGIELSATFFITNNTPPFLAAIGGALTLGFVTAVIMLFNGVLIGNLVVAIGLETGIGPIIALIVPHGIFELPALFVAAGVGFRLLHRAGQRIAGTRDALFTRAYLVRTGALVVFGWLLLVLAAFVEAYLTVPIAELFFPEQAG
ncbi:stage II sporulation protein M [Halosolutus amylolyticus]|uniref:Stage II sporulation protein M n=1 Tax=Halosolutus amylolyticus TaxID=2932267 RepID=A0ABD5PJ91_9EURY|nr:stage II sporulation protein M [Halosolutus amylolyticus]